MLKSTLLCLTLLLASSPESIKLVELERLDKAAVHVGAVVEIKASVVFTHEACDEAADQTSFYARGAEIIERGPWQRIDKISLYRLLKVRVKDPVEAVVTLQLVKHTQKATDQLKIAIEN